METPRALAHPANLLVQTALKIAPGEHFVVIEDAHSARLGDALADAGDLAGAWVRRARLDRLGSRPHRAIPDELRLALTGAQASVFVASALHHEAPMRQALLHMVQQHKIRHAHLPGVTEEAFVVSVRLHYDDLRKAGDAVMRAVEGGRTLVVESDEGTSLKISLEAGTRWFAQLGVVEPGVWGSFPAGALYTSPANVSGVFVADASLGEFFGAREGLLAGKPVRMLIEEGRVKGVEAPRSPSLVRDVEAMLGFATNSDRVGLVAIGVNYGIEAPTGEASVDQNIPGLHLGIGDPAGKASGATWRAPTCFAACASRTRVAVDGVEIIRDRRIVLGARRVSSERPRLFHPGRSLTPTR